MNKVVLTKLYMCGVSWQYEIGEKGSAMLFEDIETLKAHKKCTDECGIVELRATLSEVSWPAAQNIKIYNKEDGGSDGNDAA